MKHLKTKVILFTAVSVLTLGSAVTVSAAGRHRPADIVAAITGRAVANVIQERFETGKTFGTIAAEAGKLDEFKDEMLNAKEEILNENVENGVISQEQADEILETVQERQAECDGTGYGDGLGCGFVYRDGTGYGPGCVYGDGTGYGPGCIYSDGTGNVTADSTTSSGDGSDYGNGNGSGYGNGNGNGYGNGNGFGRGGGNGAGYGRGQGGGRGRL